MPGVGGSWQRGEACWDCRKGEGVRAVCSLEAATGKQPQVGREEGVLETVPV